MNVRLLFRLLSIILLTMTLGFSVSILVAYLSEGQIRDEAELGWVLSLVIAAGLSIAAWVLGRGSSTRMFRQEALTVIGLGWVLCSVIGALPYWMIIDKLTFIDALFESTSGITTTGATILVDPSELPPSLQFWRAFSQWIGGLGVVVFFVAILSFLGVGAKILYSHESSGKATELETTRVQKGVLKILFLYITLTLLCAASYRYFGMGLFDAVCHSFTTVATAGFSNYADSFAHFESAAIEWTAVVFMILGGTPFLLMLRLLKGKFSEFSKSVETQVYLALLAVFTVIIGLFLYLHDNPLALEPSIRIAAFHVTSLMTTTGFSSYDYNLVAPVAHVFLLILMAVGGCSGSTAGGLKVVRVILGGKLCLKQIEKAFRPNVVRAVRMNKKPVEPGTQETVLSYFLITLVVYAGVLFLVALFEPNLSFEGITTGVHACVFNIGPAFAELGPMENYSFLSNPTKVILSFTMIAGRLEFLALLVLVMPSLWKGFR